MEAVGRRSGSVVDVSDKPPKNKRRQRWLAVCAFLLWSLLAWSILPPRSHRSMEKIRQGQSRLSDISSLLDQLQLDCGRYPTTAEGLKALVHAPPCLASKWKGPYDRDPHPLDVYGNPLVYESDGNSYTVTSLGADGKPSGREDSDDADVTERG